MKRFSFQTIALACYFCCAHFSFLDVVSAREMAWIKKAELAEDEAYEEQYQEHMVREAV